MRARVALTIAAALVVSSVGPALAAKRRIPVPFLHCYAYVEVPDVYVSATNHGVRAGKYGQTEVSSDC